MNFVKCLYNYRTRSSLNAFPVNGNDFQTILKILCKSTVTDFPVLDDPIHSIETFTMLKSSNTGII